MISHEHKFIFIHIPKTAGTSVENLFFSAAERVLHPSTPAELQICRSTLFGQDVNKKYLQHLTAEEIKHSPYITPEYFKNYFTFTFVRNPWDRAVSEWKWRTASNPKSAHLSLEEFLNKVARKREDAHDMSQYSFIYDKNQHKLVKFIGRFEKLQEDFLHICKQIKHPPTELPHANKTERKPYQEYYNTYSKELVGELFKEDIKIFNYTF